MIVTIDGPAGAGKSSAARALARRLAFDFLDTGAMFRAVALAALRADVALDDKTRLRHLLGTFQLDMSPGQIRLNGEDVRESIRTPEVSAASSVVAACPVVRHHLAALQREMAAGRNIVCEGRDQGTVVFPEAACKFFLTADPEERLRRRAHEMNVQPTAGSLESLRRAQAERDHRDSNREFAPLRPAADAFLIDSTGQTLDQVVSIMEQEVRRRLTAAPS